MTDQRPTLDRRLIVPIGGFAVLTVISFTLIVAVVIRPWGRPDKSWQTHMNLTEEPYVNYTRAPQSFVSSEGKAPLIVWRVRDAGAAPQAGPDGSAHWVAHGCASCHGLDGTGGAVGPNVLAKTVDELRDRARFGPKGMPAFVASDLPDDDFAALAAYVESMRAANPGAVPTATPAATAVAQPTAVPATPQPTAAAGSGGTPFPAATAQPTEAPTASPPAGPAAPADDLLARGRLLYNETAGPSGRGCAYCHGPEGSGAGEGASNAPDIRGLSRSQVRNAMSNVFDMRDFKLTAEEIEAVVEYLRYLNEQ